jgi:hypothetical protein
VQVATELVPDHGELAERRVDDPGLRRRFEEQPGERDESEQQREQREEAVVGDERGELPGAVLPEPFEHGHSEAEGRDPSLDPVPPADRLLHDRYRHGVLAG